MLSGGY